LEPAGGAFGADLDGDGLHQAGRVGLRSWPRSYLQQPQGRKAPHLDRKVPPRPRPAARTDAEPRSEAHELRGGRVRSLTRDFGGKYVALLRTGTLDRVVNRAAFTADIAASVS
jgi:hypothetical protein